MNNRVCYFSGEVPEGATTKEEMWVRDYETCNNPYHNKREFEPRTAHTWKRDGETYGLWHWGSDKEISKQKERSVSE